MCGIAGILDFACRPTLAELEPMVERLRHRGPDADGMMLDGPLAMGMRRLSIIDLASGDQPLANEDSTVHVVFNGEIFNYVELRQELICRGHTFATRSDTEVLLHGYEQWGADLLPRLNGMFAFAIWDRRLHRMMLARDRMGVKPLYYAYVNGRLSFASELKALRTQSKLDQTLDTEALSDYLRLGYVPHQASPLRAVRRLLPGHVLVADPQGYTIRQWWNLEACAPPSGCADTNDGSEFVTTFDDAVRVRMRSDVPVAAFLSGGLDSSLVSATATRFSPYALSTYTMAFTSGEVDESPYADLVARRYATDHHRSIAHPDDAIRELPRLLWYMDEPLADSAIIPNYLISRFAAERVKVCLSGLGGDELFGGYPRYVDRGVGRIRQLFRRAPRLAGALAPAMAGWRPAWADEFRIASDNALEWRTYLHAIQTFDTSSLRRLGFPAEGNAESLIEDLWHRYPGSDWVGRRQFIDQHTYLPDQILALTDRMSMAVSLEVRVPFMDHRLVQFAAALPGSRKQTRNDFKIYLKQVLGERVPQEILGRQKWGFASPVARWLTTSSMLPLVQRLPEMMRDLFDPRGVRVYVRDAATIAAYAGHVWNLLALHVWLRIQAAQQPPDMPITELF